ncbi:non-homologous end-joining DNA ligase [Actinocrispum sp. NPDC049592]|uniref:non-homologous end-joining DNA ligase n=1 Tax=Actinocrispum sp. NPDC049592 TaxID=3154835 RepID=UPI0034229AC7
MPGDLSDYRRKRDAKRTPEPMPQDGVLPHGNDDTFVIQEHHARQLHWDVRLERGGVLVSFAVPKGLPPEPKVVRMAVHTEDHPLEYATFEGVIPKGEYGAGKMTIWDRGTYETLKWKDTEVDVVLRGERVRGRFTFFKGGEGWMVVRRGAPQDPGWESLPEQLEPMLATVGEMPGDPEKYAYEFKWDGVRALVRVEGGRLQIFSRAGNEVTATYPDLAELGKQLGSAQAWLDGEIVAFAGGKPSFAELQKRMHIGNSAQARKVAGQVPVSLLIFDLLHFEGRSLLRLPFADRRALLEKLELRGPNWYTSPSYPGAGDAVLKASREQGLEGVIAKRLDSRYVPGRSTAWIKVADVRPQEVVIGGWRPGEGRREGVLGALLLGIPEGDGLRFVGSVGTGFSDADLESLTETLRPLARKTSPFNGKLPPERARGAKWVEPTLVGEVVFRIWTPDNRMRAPVWRGLRSDKSPGEVRLNG